MAVSPGHDVGLTDVGWALTPDVVTAESHGWAPDFPGAGTPEPLGRSSFRWPVWTSPVYLGGDYRRDTN